MKYWQSWQDFMRDPVNKALKESKGIHACKQKYIQESNKMQWYDPVILQEGQQDAGLINAANASDGGGTPFICGHTAEVSTFTFTDGVPRDDVSGSALHGAFFDVEAYNGQVDFTAGHTNSMKTFRFMFVTGASATNDAALTFPSSIDGVVTASSFGVFQTTPGAGADTNITASLLEAMTTAVAGQSATGTVLGFTNTIAPSALFTAITSSRNTLQITNKKKASVAAVSSGGMTLGNSSGAYVSLGSASIATSTTALDTFFADQGGITFDGDNLPYSNNPRKAASGD